MRTSGLIFCRRYDDPKFFDSGPLSNGGPIRQYDFSGAVWQWPGHMARH
jgi:hypothetical protein